MTDFVLNHALNQIWFGAPYMDQELITKPVKISPIQGALGYVKVMWRLLGLPTNDSYYFVYQIGQVDPTLFNIPYTLGSWMNAGDLMVNQQMIAKVYNDEGLLYPVGECWFYVGDDNNLLMAVRALRNHPVDFTMQPVHLQLYSNDYVNSTRWGDVRAGVGKPQAPMIGYAYTTSPNSQSITNFRNQVAAAVTATVPGATVSYFKNGRYYSSLSGSNDILVGDYVEAVVDASVKAVRMAPLSSMLGFTSTLDTGMTKRLFPPVTDLDTIDYFGAVDFYLVSSTSNSIHRQGIYYNQELPRSVRMVTHNCYSLLENQIQSQITADTVFNSDADVHVVAIVRNSGLYRPLLKEGRRISELYRLSVDGILSAMVGTQATIPEWTAASLEASAYTALMGDQDTQYTTALVQDAYGYNLMTRTFAPVYPPIYSQAGTPVFDTPIGLTSFVITGYDSEGAMVSMTNCTGVSTEPVPSPAFSTANVELTPGLISDGSWANRYLGVPVVTLPTPFRQLGFRCYVCPQFGGVPNNRWIDATATQYYTLSDDGLTLTWDLDQLNTLQYYPAVIVGGESVTYRIPLNTVDPFNGYLDFSVTVNAWTSPAWPPNDPVGATIQNAVSTIQPGSFEVFMDGASLVEGVDFTVIWPRVVIMRKPARTPSEGLEIWVRGYGFCHSNMTREGPREVGFVIGGVCSLDLQHQLRDDRNYRLSIGGVMTLPSAASWAEAYVATDTGSPLNGLPYGLTDVVMPVDGYLPVDTYAYRTTAVDRDIRMGEYLTGALPGTPMPSMNPINGKYELVSPFMSALIHQFLNGWVPGDLTVPYNNVAIDTWVTPWKYLLAYDPCQMVGLNMSYIHIIPHQYSSTVTLTSAQYTFLETVIGIYLNPPNLPARLDLTEYITISG